MLPRKSAERKGRVARARQKPIRLSTAGVDMDASRRSARDADPASGIADAILDSVRQGLIILDADLRVTRANSYFCEMFGVTPGVIVGRALSELGRGPWDMPALAAWLEKARPGARPTDYEVEHEVPGVGRRVTMLNARILDPKERRYRILLAIADVTEARQAAETRAALEEAERRLDAETEASRLKDQFLATVSHELRGPLSAIGGWVHVLSSGKADDAIQEQALTAIERAVQAEARLIDDLIDLSRILAAKLHLSRRIVDLSSVVETAVGNAKVAAEAKEIRLELTRSDPEGAFILGDPDRLQQIVWNLVSNALKFTPRGGQVALLVERTERWCELRVSDTGEGIHPGFLPHVFERFRQADVQAKRKHPGLGLGLTIVRHLVELHGGQVAASSEGEGKGATFTVRMPAAAAPDSPLLEARHRAPETPGAGTDPDPGALRGLRIILVEDERDAREALTALLEQYGASVKATASAAEGLQLVSRTRPDLLVSDIGMPILDGYALMRRVRALSFEEGGKTPALALSAYASPQDREQALAAGFQSHMAKPPAAAELVARLRTLAKQSPPS